MFANSQSSLFFFFVSMGHFQGFFDHVHVKSTDITNFPVLLGFVTSVNFTNSYHSHINLIFYPFIISLVVFTIYHFPQYAAPSIYPLKKKKKNFFSFIMCTNHRRVHANIVTEYKYIFLPEPKVPKTQPAHVRCVLVIGSHFFLFLSICI